MTKRIKIKTSLVSDPFLFHVEETDGKFFLKHDNGFYLQGVSGTEPLEFLNLDFASFFLNELIGIGDLKINNSKLKEDSDYYKILSLLSLILKNSDGIFTEENIIRRVVYDKIFNILAGPEQVEQLARLEPILSFLDEIDFTWHSINCYMYHDDTINESSENDRLTTEVIFSQTDIQAVKRSLRRLNLVQKACFEFLVISFNNSVFLPLAFVNERISVQQYAQCYMAQEAFLNSGRMSSVSRREQNKLYQHLSKLLNEVKVILDKGKKYNKSALLRDIIDKGESVILEFKSTLRYDIKEDKNNREMTHSCLKTIAAFLNSEGGILLIGITDSGDIHGIEKDGFENVDKFLLYLTDIVKDRLGIRAIRLVNFDFIEFGKKTVCKVECLSSKKPVYLKNKKFKEFYVRHGPQSPRLDKNEANEYIESHFKV